MAKSKVKKDKTGRVKKEKEVKKKKIKELPHPFSIKKMVLDSEQILGIIRLEHDEFDRLCKLWGLKKNDEQNINKLDMDVIVRGATVSNLKKMISKNAFKGELNSMYLKGHRKGVHYSFEYLSTALRIFSEMGLEPEIYIPQKDVPLCIYDENSFMCIAIAPRIEVVKDEQDCGNKEKA